MTLYGCIAFGPVSLFVGSSGVDKNCHEVTGRATLWRQKTTYLCHFILCGPA